MARVIVIGSGAGGMAVAARLAVRRHEVTVVERSASAGGKLAGYSRDGFVFDTGPSLLTLPAVYRDLFAKTGAALEEVLDLVEPDPGFGYRFADGTTVDLPPVDPGRCATAFGDGLGGVGSRRLARSPGSRGQDLAGHPPAVPAVAADWAARR